MFRDRSDAGAQLAQKLLEYRGADAAVLALPRGGVVVGAEVARVLGVPLDIVVPRKVGHPNNPEYAICAVDQNGTLLRNEREAAAVDAQWLKKEIEKERQEAARRVALYRGGRKPRALINKIAIIVDDGIATGLTARLAVMAVKKQNPRKIVVAVPVASQDAVRLLQKDAQVVVLEPPENFMGTVGAHYEQFPQTSDAEVITLLSGT